MRLLYSIGIYVASFHLKLIALFNTKLKQGVNGRKETFKKLNETIKANDKTFWFHCASLGEYEQGLPVFEALKKRYPSFKVVLSFFSPSGYEVKKNTQIADVVVYLPLDTKTNAKRFLAIINPDYIVFVKYEIWPNFLLEMKKRHLSFWGTDDNPVMTRAGGRVNLIGEHVDYPDLQFSQTCKCAELNHFKFKERNC